MHQMDASSNTSTDPRQLLHQWAWFHDLDQAECLAAEACAKLGNDPGGEPARIVWQAVAAFGHKPGLSALRKLRRAAMARVLARDLRGEISWSMVDVRVAEQLAHAAWALDDLSKKGRPQVLWAALAQESAHPGFEPGEAALAWAQHAGIGAPPWISPGSRGEQALSDFDWTGGFEEDLRRAGYAWAMLERDKIDELLDEGKGEGKEHGPQRL